MSPARVEKRTCKSAFWEEEAKPEEDNLPLTIFQFCSHKKHLKSWISSEMQLTDFYLMIFSQIIHPGGMISMIINQDEDGLLRNKM